MTTSDPSVVTAYGLTKHDILAGIDSNLENVVSPDMRGSPYYALFMDELGATLPDDLDAEWASRAHKKDIPSWVALFILATNGMVYATVFDKDTLDASHFSIDLRLYRVGSLGPIPIPLEGPPWIFWPDLNGVFLWNDLSDRYFRLLLGVQYVAIEPSEDLAEYYYKYEEDKQNDQA